MGEDNKTYTMAFKIDPETVQTITGEDEYSSYEIYNVFIFIALVSACIALGCNIVTLVGWLASPTASVIKEIITML